MGPLHSRIQNEIRDILLSLGYNSECEHRGNGWVADVFAERDNTKFVFEVQLSPQSYKRTEERQAMYLKEGIISCWLFEKDPSRKKQERQDLPVFRVFERDNRIFVSLKGRKELSLEIFIRDFVSGRIKFCKTLKPLPKVEVNFIEFPCYRCGSLNHIYFLSPFKSACNVEISEMEAEEMWSDSKFSFDKRIVEKVQSYAKLRGKDNINLACIKRRYSNTVGDEYLSFGCNDCDALFGDSYVHEAIIDCLYGDGIVEKTTFETDAVEEFRHDIPHWCHPGENDFCE